MQFIFAIYSCKKYLETKTKFLYKLLKNKLKHCKIYIIYGDETLSTDYEIIDDTYLVLKCGDLYENLSQKTLCLFNTIEKIHPTAKGVFKCDDDILPNIEKLNELFHFISYRFLLGDSIPYLGFQINYEYDFYFSENMHKMTNEKYKIPLLVRACSYAAGPLYYLSMDSIHTLNRIYIIHDIRQDPIHFMFEDNMIGYLLSKHNIMLFHYNTYYDNICDYHKGCIQNIDNKYRNLYIYLQGGLGNQLFQVAVGFELAKKNNMFLILVYRTDFQYNMTHNASVNEFFSTIFSNFNYISWDDVDFTKAIELKEDKCFDYYHNIIEQTDKDYYLNGYFQNKKYLDIHKKELLYIFCESRAKTLNVEYKKDILEKYPHFANSYFIHIRRGDYIGHPLYTFDKDAYLNNAISYILERYDNLEKKPHFYIFSNDIEFCKSYSVLESIEKTFIEDLNTLDSFYCMSLCRKGGICANSTFSGWASMLNDNPDKVIVVPKNWINVDYAYEIPFDYTISF